MPNWIENNLEIVSDGSDAGNEQLKEFIGLLGEDTIFEFNKIIPEPNELKNTISPRMILSDNEYEEWQKDNTDNDQQQSFISETMSNKLIKNYGNYDWYDWRVFNWGCKWDVSEYKLIQCSDKIFQCFFLTPWSPPYGVYETISNKYPNLILNEESIDIG